MKLGAVEHLLVALRHFLKDQYLASCCCEIFYFLAIEIEEELHTHGELLAHVAGLSCKTIVAHPSLSGVSTPVVGLLFALSTEDGNLRVIADHAKDFHFATVLRNLDPADEDGAADAVGLLSALLENEEWRKLVLTSGEAAEEVKGRLEEIIASEIIASGGAASGGSGEGGGGEVSEISEISEGATGCVDALCEFLLLQRGESGGGEWGGHSEEEDTVTEKVS